MSDDYRFRPGMLVVATDGLVGEVDSLQSELASPSTNTGDLFVRGTDGVVRIATSADVERVDDDIIHLRVASSALPELAEDAGTNAERFVESGDGTTIPVAEERLSIETRVVELGVAHVRKHVEEFLTEDTVPLDFEEIEIERVPVNEIVENYPVPYVDGDVLVVPLVEEEIVEVIVRRRLRLTEQVRIRRTVQQRQETVQVPLRREHVEVDEMWHESPQPLDTPDALRDLTDMSAPRS